MTALHILRLINPENDRFRVNLFVRDEDLYFVAFSVEELPNDEERARGARPVQSPCFRFKDNDIKLPSFLNCEVINMESSYGLSTEFTPGGSSLATDNMFNALLKYSRARRISLQFRKVVYSVFGLYCEARRLLSALNEMAKRISEQSEAKQVSDQLWLDIHAWTKFGQLTLEDLADGCLALENALPHWCHKYHKMSFMSSIIQEVLIIKSKPILLKKILCLSDNEFEDRWKLWKRGAARDTSFVIPPA